MLGFRKRKLISCPSRVLVDSQIILLRADNALIRRLHSERSRNAGHAASGDNSLATSGNEAQREIGSLVRSGRVDDRPGGTVAWVADIRRAVRQGLEENGACVYRGALAAWRDSD